MKLSLRTLAALSSGVVLLGSLASADTLSGRVITSGGSPLANIDLDFFDAGGNELLVPNDRTDAGGNFFVDLPAGNITFDIRPLEVTPLYAPRQLLLVINGNVALGDLVLRNGFFVSATAQRPNGAPIPSADADAVDLSNDEKLFTPGDNSDGAGFLRFVVPAGDYAIDICPPSGVLLAAALRRPVNVNSNTNLGVVTLPNGVVLSGQVTDPAGSPVANADLDVDLPNNGGSIPTCDDNTDAQGQYLVVVPTGTYDLTFSVPQDPSQGAARVDDVVVAANTTVNGKLAGVEGTRYCVSNVNTSGQAGCISGVGSAVVGAANFTLVAESLPPNKLGLFFGGPGQINVAFGEGRRCAGGQIFRVLPFSSSNAAGVASRGLDFGNPTIAARVIPGASLNFQFWFRDPMGGPGGFNLTDGLNVVWR